MRRKAFIFFLAVFSIGIMPGAYPLSAYERNAVYKIEKTESDKFKYKDVFKGKTDPLTEDEDYQPKKTSKKRKKRSTRQAEEYLSQPIYLKENPETYFITRTFSYKNFDGKFVAVYFSIDSADYKRATSTHGQALEDRICDPNNHTCRKNLPSLARKEAPYVSTIQNSMARAVSINGYSTDREITATILSFVQNAIPYKVPPDEHLAGLLLPVEALVEKYGDCDTKSLLMATLLSYWKHIKMIAIQIKDHTFLGAAVPVAPGDEVLEHNGIKYVLMEPAGSGYPLGMIADYSRKEMTKWYVADEF